MDQVADHFLTPKEVIRIAALPLREGEAQFYAFWTRKEARLKATGKGLFAALSEDQSQTQSEQEGAWMLQDLPLKSPYVGALAYKSPLRSVKVRDF
jgi:phosphopantetheinyl transferase